MRTTCPRRWCAILTLATGLAALGAAACVPEGAETAVSGRNAVTIVGVDYAFAAPDTLPPGPTEFTFENHGSVRHEMILRRLKAGTTLEDVLRAVSEGADSGDFTEGGAGILITAPSTTSASRVTVDLIAGRTYVLVCSLQDGPDAPSHQKLGMRTSFYVAARSE